MNLSITVSILLYLTPVVIFFNLNKLMIKFRTVKL